VHWQVYESRLKAIAVLRRTVRLTQKSRFLSRGFAYDRGMPASDPDAGPLRTRNLDEAIDAVTRVYCPHTVEVVGRPRGIDAVLKVTHSTFQPLVNLSYSTPVKIDAQNMSRLFLMMHCASGAASTTQEHRTAEWKAGQTMPFSANFDTKLQFDPAFVQKSVRLDMNRLEAQCARWLGYPIAERLRFDLRPFSDELEQIWQRTLAYGWSSEDRGLPLAGAAKTALDEYLLKLLLHHHPHNYSDELGRSVPTPVPGIVRRAERFIIDNASASITVSNVADHLGISLRSLQAGFRQWRETTPSTFLRQARLQLARDELLRSGPEANVTTVALRHGFSHLGRFSAQYRSAFGEDPSATLRRGRAALARR
jgi:AraC-like DNA-binding protein